MLDDIGYWHGAPFSQDILPEPVNTEQGKNQPQRNEIATINVRHFKSRLLGNTRVIHVQHTGTHQYESEKRTDAG